MSEKYMDLASVVAGSFLVGAMLGGSVNMLGGGRVWGSVVFLGVLFCGLLLGKRIHRHYDRRPAENDEQ